MIIDVHCHAFPDSLAPKAMKTLCAEADVTAFTDGTLAGLLASMDRSGIEKAVVASIATKETQYSPILEWSLSIASERIIPFASIYPQSANVMDKISQIRKAGLKGIKMHPYYQNFYIDSNEIMPIYKKIADEGLVLLMHCGFDIAFERVRRADPLRIAKVIEAVPGLKMIAAHMGAWEDWQEVEKHLLGKDIYFDTSFAFDLMEKKRLKRILAEHNPEYILYGSDSPWTDQEEAIRKIHQEVVGNELKEKILFTNANKLLNQEEK